MQRLLKGLIRAYRLLFSPWVGRQCRFDPTCSRYAEQAIELYGPGRGSWLALRRLLRCHPLCPGGADPVPGNEDAEHHARLESSGRDPNHRAVKMPDNPGICTSSSCKN